MSERTARNLVWSSLVAAMVLGGMVAIFGFVWLPTYQAASVDVILNPDELRDPKLIEVVYRTHRHNESKQATLGQPYQVFGIMIAGVALAGLVGLRRWNPSSWKSDPRSLRGG